MKCQSKLFNLALIDVKLPDMDGMELVTTLNETAPKTVKIIITGHPTLQDATNPVNKNVDTYLLKPLNMSVVLETIHECLRRQRKAEGCGEEEVMEFLESRTSELGGETTPELRNSAF